jgi:arylsulfatase
VSVGGIEGVRCTHAGFWIGVVLAVVAASATRSVESRPNILVILSDDVGYSDLGCYGGEIRTPHLDALASAGVRFSQFYNTARCCPTRASLLTGLYPHQAGIGHMVDGPGPRSGLPAYAGELNQKVPTLAEALRAAGYATYLAGKWHVTGKLGGRGPEDRSNWPVQRGFDRFYGTIHGAGSFYDPNTLVRDETRLSPYADPEYQPDTFYYTDAINDQAIRFLREHRSRAGERPFLLYISHTAGHWPLHAPEADVARQHGRYDAGYGAIQAARLEKMRGLGLLDARWSPPVAAGDWASVPDRAWEARGMEVYAAMLERMDAGLGRVFATLREVGAFEQTLILYLQDNGGCAEPMGRNGRGVARAPAPTLPSMAADALQPDMIPRQTRDGYPVRQGRGVLPGPPDTYLGYGKAWAGVSNTPFREYKHWVHEGGIASPLIAHWPAGIPPARRGTWEPQPAHLIDIMATALDLAGAPPPPGRHGAPPTPLEGVSLRPAFSGLPLGRSEPLFWEHEGNAAVRLGDWKLVRKHPGDWELYHLAADRVERHNLAAQHPDRVRELAARYDAWAKRVGVAPWPLSIR